MKTITVKTGKGKTSVSRATIRRAVREVLAKYPKGTPIPKSEQAQSKK